MKKIRLKHKFLEKFSNKTGISKSVLTSYIMGRTTPSLSRAIYLEQVSGIPVELWANGTPDMKRAAINNAMTE